LKASPDGGSWSGSYISESGLFDATGLTAGDYNVIYTYTSENDCVKADTAVVTVNPNPDCLIVGGTPGNAPYCVGMGLPAPLGVYSAPAGMNTYKWTTSGAISIIGDDTLQSVSIQVNGVGILYLELSNASGCTSTCQRIVLVQQGAPCTLNGPENVCAGSENTYSDQAASEEGTVFEWTLTDLEGEPLSSEVAYFVGRTDTSSVVVKAGALVGAYVVRLMKIEPGVCPSVCQLETTIEICAKPYCTYTQGYFGNTGGKACTPDGQKTTTQLITGSLANMPGGILYLGVSGRSFTATNAADIIRILPGGGTANRLPLGNHTPSSSVILKNGRVNNVLLSQTMTLALNTYMQGSNLGSFSLAAGGGSSDKYLVTVAKKGGSCDSLASAVPAECKFKPVYCSDSVTISGYTTTYNPYKSWKISSKVINALPGDKTVLDLLNLASAALGGTLPEGVSYTDVAGAVGAINEAFDECRLFVEFSATGTVSGYCTPPAGNICPVITSSRMQGVRNNSISVVEPSITIFPNPFKEQLNFRFVSPVSGKATLELYTVHGQRIAVVFDGNVTAGVQQAVQFINTTHVSGMLIYKLNVGGKVLSGKVQTME